MIEDSGRALNFLCGDRYVQELEQVQDDGLVLGRQGGAWWADVEEVIEVVHYVGQGADMDKDPVDSRCQLVEDEW